MTNLKGDIMQHEHSAKPSWVAPKLIILERGNPEECVLEPCYRAENDECIFGGTPTETLSAS